MYAYYFCKMTTNNNNNNKHDYTTKDDKQHFITWFINKYGYNVDSHYNSRTLSEEYQTDTNRLIPKITIHRWLLSIKEYQANPPTTTNHNTKYKKTTKTIIAECIEKYVSNYVAEQFH